MLAVTVTLLAVIYLIGVGVMGTIIAIEDKAPKLEHLLNIGLCAVGWPIIVAAAIWECRK